MAKTKTKKGKTPEQRAAEILALKAQLETYQATATPEQIAEVVALFDGYSPRNAQLIAAQLPTATDVDAYGAWRDRGRQVRKMDKAKNEHGIRIMAPAGSYSTTTGGGEVTPDGSITEGVTSEWTRFRVVTVFDITQTDPIVPVTPAQSAANAAYIEQAAASELEEMSFEEEACSVA